MLNCAIRSAYISLRMSLLAPVMFDFFGRVYNCCNIEDGDVMVKHCIALGSRIYLRELLYI